jgi:hypothetical protein
MADAHRNVVDYNVTQASALYYRKWYNELSIE